jgi:hypothetical protein
MVITTVSELYTLRLKTYTKKDSAVPVLAANVCFPMSFSWLSQTVGKVLGMNVCRVGNEWAAINTSLQNLFPVS